MDLKDQPDPSGRRVEGLEIHHGLPGDIRRSPLEGGVHRDPAESVPVPGGDGHFCEGADPASEGPGISALFCLLEAVLEVPLHSGKGFEIALYDGRCLLAADSEALGKADLILYAKGSAKPSADEGVYVYELGTDIFLSEDTKGYMAFHKDVERTKFNEGRDYLYPIPSGERSLNKNLTQNPGWNDGLGF